MEEAERLCNRIVLIDHGRIVAQGTGTELIALAGTEPRLEIVTKKALPKGWSNGIAGVIELPWEVLDEFAAALTLATIDQMSHGRLVLGLGTRDDNPLLRMRR